MYVSHVIKAGHLHTISHIAWQFLGSDEKYIKTTLLKALLLSKAGEVK